MSSSSSNVDVQLRSTPNGSADGQHYYEGFATMYMRMPMSTSTLPIQGQCTVNDRRVMLRFPFTGIEFELPATPASILHRRPLFRETSPPEYDFKIRGVRGDLLVTIRYIGELNAFAGVGIQQEEHGDGSNGQPALTFCFYSPSESLLSRLPRI
jgi:hypothetical protein